MKVALISDLHANAIALRAVLRHIDRLRVDQVICLGDLLTLGPRPLEVLDLLRERRVPCILGNHDEFLIDAELIHTYSEIPIIVESVDWCRSQLSSDDLDFIRSFPRTLEPVPGLFLFHGTPRSNMEDLISGTPMAEVDEMLGPRRARVLAGGHTHLQMLRQHRGALIVNPGSAGMPFREYAPGGPPVVLAHAELATVELDERSGAVDVTFHRVPLDRAELRAAADDSALPLRGMLAAQYA